METAIGEIHAQPILFTLQQTSPVKHFTLNNFWDVQIVFQPTAIFLLTGIPVNKLTNQFFDATNIFSKNIKSTFAQLQ